MIDKTFLFWAIVLMLIFIVRDYLQKHYDIDMDSIQLFKPKGSMEKAKEHPVIDKGTGKYSITLVDAGRNSATVMATIRQITGFDYDSAKLIVSSTPYTFMTSISDKEANLTKKALEFVGAKIEIA